MAKDAQGQAIRIPIFAANWKMNKLEAEVPEFVSSLSGLLADLPVRLGSQYEVVLAPASVHIPSLVKALSGKPMKAAAQNSGPARFGAFTGEVSPVMLKDLGCEWVILGHSERRHVFKEDDALIQSRLMAAFAEGLHPILCVGEVLQDRQAGKTFQTVETQLSILKGQSLSPEMWRRLVIAYEPVWAIGTGETATPGQAQEVHAFIRKWVGDNLSAEEAGRLRILYGGSVKPENSESLLAQKDVDGFLVGTASLDAAVFAGVIKNGLKNRA